MSIRIIAGSAKGRLVPSSKDRRLRPTSQRVRGAIFSLIGPAQIQGARVLDLYAGTGALGLEALSRGASTVDFVEKSPRLCASIRATLLASGLPHEAHVYCMMVEKALSRLSEGYDVVLMDPPYETPSMKTVISHLGRGSLLNEGGLLVVEHSQRNPLEESFDNLIRVKSRRYGDTCVSVYERGGQDE